MEHGAAASHAPGNVHEQKSPSAACASQLASSLPPRLPPETQLEAMLSLLTGWEEDGAARFAPSWSWMGGCPGTRGQTRLHSIFSPQPQIPESTSRATFRLHFGHHSAFLPSSTGSVSSVLQWLGTSPRNTVFAEWGCTRGEPPAYFSFYICREICLAKVFPSLLHLSVLHRLSLLLMGHLRSDASHQHMLAEPCKEQNKC